MKHIINVAVIAYRPSWGDIEKNLERMSGYAECAAKRGADLILFPETALSGYDIDPEHTGIEQMHVRLAESIPGPATDRMAKVAAEQNIYIVFGMPERGENGNIYNSAVVIGPTEGVIGTYRKLHLPPAEQNWAVRGTYPFWFETVWGRMGVSICYDTYVFPEIMRYYAAIGCRLILNPCAVNTAVTARNIKESLEYNSVNNAVFIATSNCTGCAHTDDFVGGSNIIGPGRNIPAPHYYAGYAPGTPGSEEQEMYIGTLDLTFVGQSWHQIQWDDEKPDFRPDLYTTMYEEVQKLPRYHK